MRHVEPTTWQLLQEDRLSDDEMNALLGHLEECPRCQASYMDAVTPRFEELAELLIPDDFTAKTMLQIRELPTVKLDSASSVAPTVVRSRLTPIQLFRQRLTAYAIAASLTMALMVGGAFTQLSSLPRPQVLTPPPAIGADHHLMTAKSEMLGPLLPQSNALPSAQQPLKLPPLRQLVERSIANDSKK